MKIDELLLQSPFTFKQGKKNELFLNAMKESIQWHYMNSPLYKKFVDNQKLDLNKKFTLEEIPPLPISLFKDLELLTVPKSEIKSTIYSSATTSNKPSQIFLDSITIKRQQTALKNILSDYLGSDRRVFIIFDSKETILQGGMNTSSRSSAIRGMSTFAKSMKFVLNKKLEFDPTLYKEALDSIGKNEKVCFFGFTWLLYQAVSDIDKNKKNQELIKFYIKEKKYDATVLHIGGWKKLKDVMVNKSDFNKKVSMLLGAKVQYVIDFYGMTEQLGTVYPDCEFGYKHAPLYSEVLIRDVDTLENLGIMQPGFIQLLSPLPHSYPGISLLTEDIGELIGIDDCKCKRGGKYFIFKNRAETAPPKGCGDVL